MNKQAALQSAEELFTELLALNEQIKKKLMTQSAAIERQYETELVPKLAEIEKLVNARSPVARNAAEDAMKRFREFFITSA